MESKFKITNIKLISTPFYNLNKNIEYTICSICRLNLNDNSSHNNIKTCCCGNSFHNECINKWIKIQPRCPLCSNEFNQ